MSTSDNNSGTATVGTRVFGQHWKQFDSGVRVIAVLMSWALLGGLFVAALAAWKYWLQALMWAGAFSALGWTLGFLFGIPRAGAAAPQAQATQADTTVATSTVTEQAQTDALPQTQVQPKAMGAAAGASGGATSVSPVNPPANPAPNDITPKTVKNDTPPNGTPPDSSATINNAAANSPLGAAKPPSTPDNTVQANGASGNPAQANSLPANNVSTDTTSQTQSTGQTKNATFGLQVNTNLEQISDWLTKIIVGVSLVEIDTVRTHLANTAVIVANSLSAGRPGMNEVSSAYAIILYFTASGFLGSYLLTRLFLQKQFNNAA